MDAGATILIVDDDPGFRRTISDLLREKGYTPRAAAEGKAALDGLKKDVVSVAVVDLRLQDMSGLEVMKEIKRSSPDTECILLTGHASQESAIEAVNLGAYGYVEKSYDVEHLLLDIRRAAEKAQAERALRESEERYRTLFEQSRDAVYITTRDGEFIDLNQSMLDMFGYAKEEMMELNARQLYAHAADRRRFRLEIEQEGAVGDYEVKLREKDGTEMDCLLTSTVRRAKDGSVLGYQGVIRDITERKRAQETIRRLAYHDALTGLPNRSLFNDRLGVALAQARRKQQRLAVMLLDLDHFKNVNDELGHTAGDLLLQTVGERLTRLLRESDTVCRIGGDEFLFLLPEVAEVGCAGAAAARILEAIRKPFVLDGHELHITTSLGIAIYPHDGEDADTLTKNADIAMYRAKEDGRDNYQWYFTSMRQVDTRPLGSTI